MNKLIDYFARQGVFSDLVTVFILVVGIYSLIEINREVYPNIAYDIVTVTTIFPGASAAETEKLITNPLEQDLMEINGIKKMTSSSSEGRSLIILILDPDQTTEEKAKSDAKEVVDRFLHPDGAEEPKVQTVDSRMIPIVEVSVAGDIPEKELKKQVKFIEKHLKAIPEVARVQFNGMRDHEIRVEVQMANLQKYQVSLEELIDALKRQNLTIPGGTLEVQGKEGTREFIMRTVGEFETVQDVEDTVVRANALAEVIRVKDVARVSMQFEKPKEKYRTNFTPSISMVVLKKENADAIDLVDNLKEKVASLEDQLHPQLKVSYINDFSYYIRRRLNVLSNNLGIGLTLVLIVLSLILPWKVAAVTAIGIPFSFMGAMMIFNTYGVSFNLITMMGLILVVGMLVDDAVVVTENCQRHMEKGLKPLEAAIRGTQEIWAPVTASVMTTVVVFIPMTQMTGILGKFIKYIPIGVIIALLLSLYECFFVLPHHIAKWVNPMKFKKDWGNVDKEEDLPQGSLSTWDRYFVNPYVKLVEKIIRWRYLVIFGAFLVFLGTLYVAKEKMNFILFPSDGIEIFQANMETHRGTPLEKTSELVKIVEREIQKLPKEELQDFTTSIGKVQFQPDNPAFQSGSEYAQVTIYLTPETERSRKAIDIIDEIKKKVGMPKGFAKIHFMRMQGGPPVGKAISIGVRGQNYPEIMKAVNEIETFLKGEEGVSDVSNNYVLGKEEVLLHVDRAEAAAAGLSVAQIGNTVRAAYEGIVATTIRKLDEEIDVRVSLPNEDKKKEASFTELLIPNKLGNLVPLQRVATSSTIQGISLYEHEENQRQVRVTGEVDTNVTSSQRVNGKVKEMIPELSKKYQGISFAFGGEDQDTTESMASLVRAFVISAFGIFLILVLTFKNLLQPLLILLTIPLGIMSVVWTFFVHGKPLTFLAMLGVIALAGVIVNNAIVFVDFINQRRAQGMDNVTSILEAARVRLRPIFLTTVTTVAGILPTAYGIGGLDPFVVPIALSLGWGVFFGAFLTTIVFPACLSFLDDVTNLFKKVF